jgi:hypothetical protein
MAAASFWDVFELKNNVFMCLREDKCDADLARCARVHHTWTELALNALWYGYPRTTCEENQSRTRAIALLPRNRRQNYASRVGVLDFTEFGGILAHAMFEGLAFPRLKEVVLWNIDQTTYTKFHAFRLSKYLQPTLQSLKLIDKTDVDIEDQVNWLSVSFMTEIAQRCPDLQEVLFRAPSPLIEPGDLARFFGSIRPRAVSLGFHPDGKEMLTGDLLSALSHGGCLESLIFESENYVRQKIKAVQLQRFFDVTSEPFSRLKRLDMYLGSKAVPLVPQCFPAVTWLRLEVYSTRKNESILKPIANMSQLQILEFVGDGGRNEYSLPARAFIALGSLTRLKSLHIGTSFFPWCMPEDGPEGPTYLEAQDKFTRADASDMLSGLIALEYLSVSIGYDYCPDHLCDSISRYCPRLSSVELVGHLDIHNLILPNAPVLGNVRQMTLEDTHTGIPVSQVARLIDNFAPKLEKLSFRVGSSRMQKIHTAWMEFRSTQGFFRHKDGSKINTLILGGD